LGIHIVRSRSFKCILDITKRSFYRAANAVFGKIGTTASEEVILKTIPSKCVPMLLYNYGLKACLLNKADLTLLDFVVSRCRPMHVSSRAALVFAAVLFLSLA